MMDESITPKTDADKTQQEASDGIVIEGIIIDKKEILDSALTQYVMKLENSPMFRQVSVRKNSITTFNKRDVLHFTLSAKTG